MFKNNIHEQLHRNNLLAKSYDLTLREAECLFYLLRGKSAREIGNQLNISPKTVEYYIANVKIKLKTTTRENLFQKAFDSGLINYVPPSVLYKDNNEL